MTVPQSEKHPLRPRSPYGASKAAARHIVKVYRESYNLYAVQGWLFNHEGTRRGEEFVTRKITKAVARIKYSLENNIPFAPLELGNLEVLRDWSDAEDFVDGVWRMLNQDTYRTDLKEIFDKSDVKEYVLSSNETHTIREFVELSFAEAGFKGFWSGTGVEEKYYLWTPYAVLEGGKDNTVLVSINPKFYRPAEVSQLLGDSTLARTELGWTPQTSFRQLVKKMVEHDVNSFKTRLLHG